MEAFRQKQLSTESERLSKVSTPRRKPRSRISSCCTEMERGSRLAHEGDAKYMLELSTVLVATIQETKDRISLLEHIFCIDLFPNIQSKWKSMQQVCSEAQKAAEDSWKEKEMGLLEQIEELRTKNQKLSEENEELRKSETEKKQNGYIKQLIDGQKYLQQKINELECDVKEKSIKLKGAQESVDSLFNCIERDGKRLVEYENQLNKGKRKTEELVQELESSTKEISKLQEELRQKVRDVDEAKVLREDLWRKFESQALKIANYEGILKARENEMKQQAISLKQFKETVNELQGELEIKSKEVNEGNKARQQLALQIEYKSSQLLTVEQHLKDQQCQNNKLVLKVIQLEDRVAEIQVAIRDKIIDLERKEDCIKQLSHNIESQICELVSEKNKTHDAIIMYKKLKSEHLFLLKKSGLIPEDVPAKDKEQTDATSYIPAAIKDVKKTDQSVDTTPSHAIKLKDNSGWNKHQNDGERVRYDRAAESCTRDSVNIGTSKKNNRGKASPLVGMKRPASRWRDTRSHQNQDGPDPHDDFLNTPLENIRENLNKAMMEGACDLPDNVPQEVNLSSSDDEVQKSTLVDSKRHQKQPPVPSSTGYKYVEPVRKKAERDNLRGIECKQCKKFYDAVLPNDGSSEKNLRCEHHDGVSRHRYKYIPPSTPEGFWNIGFDSEK